MNRLSFALLGLAACGSTAPTQPTAGTTAGSELDSATVAVFTKMFESNCGSCHVAPDRRFAVERAWITQLADTA